MHGPAHSEFLWLLAIGSLVAILSRYARGAVPYPLLLVIAGLGVGFTGLFSGVSLEPTVVFTVFLPPLLFESSLHLRIRDLHREWRPVAGFALLGTLCSSLIVGYAAAYILDIPLAAALVFGALISATDPISVISVFKRLGAARRLTTIMESESLFNDGVAVVLFGVFLAAAAGGTSPAIGPAILEFLGVVLGGAAIGGLLGWSVSRVMKEFDDRLLEVTLTTLVAFGAYLAAEHFHTSGVIAVVSAGLVVGNYGMPVSMSPTTRMAVVSFWEFAAFVVNSLVFLLVGISEAAIEWRGTLALTFGAVAAVLLGRASIYPLSWAINLTGCAVPRSYQHVLVWGGLRGAISMALVLGLDPEFPHRSTLVTATYGVVLFTLLVQGLTVGPLARRLGLTGAGPLASPDRADAGELRDPAEAVAASAALSELARLEARGEPAEWAIAALEQEYRTRLALAETGVDAGSAPAGEQLAALRRLAQLAERDALRAAERDETLHGEALHARIQALDVELDGGR